MAPLTPLENLLLKYPKKPWDWYGISRNPSLTMGFLGNNLEKYPWNWCGISRNPNLTMEFLENNLEKYPWDWRGISWNKFNGKYYQDLSRWKKAIENVHEELLYSPYVMGIIV